VRLTITVTDDQQVTMTEAPERQLAEVAPNGKVETFDGGSVPEVLLSMESQVAAGLLAPPGGPNY
jgi:hypothetical protein